MNNDSKLFNKLLGKPNPTTYEKIIHCDQVGFNPGMQGWFSISKSINNILIYH